MFRSWIRLEWEQEVFRNVFIQIEKKVSSDKAVSLAANILRHQFDALTNKHYNKIIQKYDIEEEDLKDALDEISKLSPKVGGNFDTQTITINQEIIPDFVIQVKDGQVIPMLNSKNAPTLRVSEEYKDILSLILTIKILQNTSRLHYLSSKNWMLQNGILMPLTSVRILYCRPLLLL
jgi:DNA-directed RNA polymerase specialized sigma54-like protein